MNNADINIGAITEALNNKVDLPTNPERAQDQIDYVVDCQIPTEANVYTWYRKYKSGWVEQGGLSIVRTVTFPIPMQDANYHWQINSIYDSATTTMYNELGALLSKSATGFSKSGNAQTFVWSVCGMAA